MANKNICIIGLLSSVVVSAVLWLPAEGVAGEPYAQAGSGRRADLFTDARGIDDGSGSAQSRQRLRPEPSLVQRWSGAG